MGRVTESAGTEGLAKHRAMSSLVSKNCGALWEVSLEANYICIVSFDVK